ncbi:MAG TPA: ATP-dependent DNA helicase [Steroidobacteraceae bacterium]
MQDIFAADGPLARAMPDFVPRRSQLMMAERVADALASRAALLVEAGTGTGKTFAYLVPALLCGARVLVSTGTRTLQDQLFSKDVPLLAAAIGMPARVALLKGRANYLCVYRLAQASAQLALEDAAAEGADMLTRIEAWSRTTRSGDLAEVPDLADSHPIRPQVTSTRENCLGVRCPQFDKCHVMAARRAAIEADLVIVNHHLLLADITLKEDGFGDLLGSADAVIVDEAHQLPDLATQFFGATVSSRQIELALQDARRALSACGALGRPMALELQGLEDALQGVYAELPRGSGRLAWGETGAELGDALAGLAAALRSTAEAIAGASREPSLAQIAAHLAQLRVAIERVALASDEEGVRTVDRSARGFSLGLLPFDISERFRSQVEQRRCAWIFTSATLAVGADFGHFAGRLGLSDAASLQIESPFDYASQAVLYLPRELPDPSSPFYTEAIIGESIPLIDAAQGGAFVLFTSHRALARGAAVLRERWAARAAGAQAFLLLVQGEAPREQLLREFRDSGSAVLLGTASFWEGVDVKGQALRLVILEKLPFASPDDPLVKARIEFLRSHGGNPFREYQLPEAALALKQGVGRLIRSEEDRGVVAICDPRMIERSYGRVLRASLPPMTVTRERDAAIAFLRRHALPARSARGPRRAAAAQ